VLEFASAASYADDYSTFLTPAQLDETFSQIEGSFVGLGIELKVDQRTLLIVHVIEGGPADEVGIRDGDRIVGVGGQSTVQLGAEKAADMLRGEAGTAVRIEVQSRETRRSIQVTRRRVDVPSVERVQILDRQNGVGYFHLTNFQKTTGRDVNEALWTLHRQGMRSLIIDLRGNPGGLLPASVNVADKFLASGLIVSTRGRSAGEDADFTAHSPGTWDTPLYVLIDGDSASASEILAGAIHDHRRGIVIGQRSYGKGSVQGIFRLNHDIGIRLTTAKFFSPSGQAISGVGIQPDVAVEMVARVSPDGTTLPLVEDPVIRAGLNLAQRNLAQR
jgi:carboxyl-terminal processing protease